MPDEMSWVDAIKQVMASANGALHYSAIADRIATLGYRTSLGATPAATVVSVISTDIKQNAEDSTFLRVSRGMYVLRNQPAPPVEVPQPVQPPAPIEQLAALEEEDEETTAIQALGMFWRRDWVSWNNSPALLGVQQRNSTPVNFCGI